MSVNPQERAEAIAEIADWTECSGTWAMDSDGMVRCSECHSIHPDILLSAPYSDFLSSSTRRVRFGRERVELTFGKTQPERGVIFDSTHVNALGKDRIVEILDKLKLFTSMAWRYTPTTDTMICYLDLQDKKDKEEIESIKYARRIFVELAMKGHQVHSILYPDAVHCLARRGQA